MIKLDRLPGISGILEYCRIAVIFCSQYLLKLTLLILFLTLINGGGTLAPLAPWIADAVLARFSSRETQVDIACLLFLKGRASVGSVAPKPPSLPRLGQLTRERTRTYSH